MMVHTTLYRKLKTEQHEPHKMVNSYCYTNGTRHKIFSSAGKRRIQKIATKVKTIKRTMFRQVSVVISGAMLQNRQSLLFHLQLIDWCLTPILQLYHGVSFMVSDVQTKKNFSNSHGRHELKQNALLRKRVSHQFKRGIYIWIRLNAYLSS